MNCAELSSKYPLKHPYILYSIQDNSEVSSDDIGGWCFSEKGNYQILNDQLLFWASEVNFTLILE